MDGKVPLDAGTLLLVEDLMQRHAMMEIGRQ